MKKKHTVLAGLTLLLLLGFGLTPPMHAEKVIIPGDVNRICYYTNFFYNYPGDDFLYHLNDRLLFMERPDGVVTSNGLRAKLRKITNWHGVIRKTTDRYNKNESNTIVLNVLDMKGYRNTSTLLNLLGLKIQKGTDNNFIISRNPSAGFADYYKFDLLKPGSIANRVNRSKYFHFHLNETELSIPWDFKFLNAITKLNLNSRNFFDKMLGRERLSLLLAVLYRLSDREINHIAKIGNMPSPGLWRKIYQDKKLLMAMYLLSHALRLDDEGKWVLPGGTDAIPFWSQMTGVDMNEKPIEFLCNLAVKDDGKLNYFFVFSSFLPTKIQKILYTGPGAAKLVEIYGHITLTEDEKLKTMEFPFLCTSNFFTLLYALRLDEKGIYFPGGLDNWKKAMDNDKLGANSDAFDFLCYLVESSKGMKDDSGPLHTFIALYTKFNRRPELLTEKVLARLVKNYDQFNVLVDFIEKLPIKKPETVIKLFDKVEALEKLGKRDRVLFTSLFQSLLELSSHAIRYAPLRYNADILVNKLIEFPFQREAFFDKTFELLEVDLNIVEGKDDLIDFLLRGVDNRVVSIDNSKYVFRIKNIFRKRMESIVDSQEVSSMATLQEINRLMSVLSSENRSAAKGGSYAANLGDACLQLPYAEISKNAPKRIREMVSPYGLPAFRKDLKRMVEKVREQVPVGELLSTFKNFKEEYLIHHLKDHLLALVYAVNAKNSKLKVFLNPNLIRLHDFYHHKGQTPWNYCGKPAASVYFAEYHFCGGLSRLNIAFANKWHLDLFKDTFIYNSPHIESVIVNLLDLFPDPQVNQYVTYNALMVDFGLDLLRECKTNATLRKELLQEFRTITAGYRYRRITGYLSGTDKSHQLYLSEIKRLGETFLKKGKYLELATHRDQMQKFAPGSLDADTSAMLAKQADRMGGIYYHTFGNLVPHSVSMFPQDVGNLFNKGWVSGEMIDEFKVKLSWHLAKKKVPPYLMGQVLYQYFNKTAARFFSQNHHKDYISTYFIFEIFNSSYLRKIIKIMKKEGQLLTWSKS